MSEKLRNYNLVDERWIPVLWNDGNIGRVGILEALAQAGRIRQIAASNPMDRVAILRFLLALLYWCKGNPACGASNTFGDSFPSDWFSKLDANRDCFNLLGDGKRFYQYAASGSGKPEKLTVNYLIQEIPTGNNNWHFHHSTDKVDGLCPACCAMGLLRLPLFATSGGRGKPPAINAKPPIYIIPSGVSLGATLRLSWHKMVNLGMPVWEKPDTELPKTGEVPLLMGLTWLPRRVWLDRPEEPEANCISCGCREQLIRLCIFAGIGSTKTDEGSPGRMWRDPHVIYEQSSKGDVTSLHASNVIGASDAAAGQWSRVLAGMIPRREAFTAGSKAWVVGFATVQNDKYLEAIEYNIPCPCSPHQIEENIERVERWQKEGCSLARRLRPPNEKASSRKHVEIPSILASIRPHVEDGVSANAGELLSGADDTWEQAAHEYRPMMEAVARSLSPGYTISSVQRRHQIACAMPDMREKTGPQTKPVRKKKEGGK